MVRFSVILFLDNCPIQTLLHGGFMGNKLNVNDIVIPILFVFGVMGGWTFGLDFLQVSGQVCIEL